MTAKEDLIANILSNSVFQPDSARMVRLRSQLLKLSQDCLEGLDMVIAQKLMDATPEGVFGAKERWSKVLREKHDLNQPKEDQ